MWVSALPRRKKKISKNPESVVLYTTTCYASLVKHTMWVKIQKTKKAMAALLMLLETMTNNVKVQKRFMQNLSAEGWVKTFELVIQQIANEVQAVEKWFNTTKCMDDEEYWGEDSDDEAVRQMVDAAYDELRALHRAILRLTKTLKTVSEVGHVPWRHDIPAKELLNR